MSTDEITYIENRWKDFPKNNVCNIASENGWLDLLIWARNNGCVCDGTYHQQNNKILDNL